MKIHVFHSGLMLVSGNFCTTSLSPQKGPGVAAKMVRLLLVTTELS
ncbi:MAG: hypothetical protein ING68_12525 [Rhodocyclaceae bacterium]|nr:hypothetical protein [Rhodocyclaceae bacterium]